MLVHFCLLAFLIFGVQRGLCIKCYSCMSKEPRDACEKLDKNKIPLKSCNLQELMQTEKYANEINEDLGKLYEVHAPQERQLPLNCLKQVIQIGDNKHYTLRGCQLPTVDNMDICVKAKVGINDLIRTTYCSLCNTDNCNNATTTSPFSVIILMIAAFFVYCNM